MLKMKKLFFISLLLLSVTVVFGQTQTKNLGKLPSVEVKKPNGETFNTADISNDGNPVIVSFWALWCKPCIKELETIADVYEDWVDDTGVKLIAVSIDDARSSAKVMPTVNGKGWDYEILLDPNSDFKRAMNVNTIPHMFILDGDGNIVWQHTSFAEGGEIEIIEVVEKVKAGGNVSGH